MEDGWKSDSMKQMNEAIHLLCQPLTTVQCRLEMASLVATTEAYREAVETGLAECRRMVEAVEAMRGILRAALYEVVQEETGQDEAEETESPQ